VIDSQEKWVLQLCHGHSPPFDDVARQWCSLFEGSGYRVLTVFLTGERDQRVENLVGGDVVFLEFESRDLRGLKMKQIRAVRALHRKYHFCFAVAHRYKSIYIATHLPEIPVIGVSHAYGVYDRYLRRRYIQKQASRLYLAGVSDAIRDDARRAMPGFPSSRIQTVYNHIDFETLSDELFSRVEARKRLRLPEDDFIVGNVGRLHPDKDQATLIKAFAKALPAMPRARLIIIGEGRLRSALERQIDELGLSDRVVLMGRVPQAARYYRAFDLFVLSSDYEPFGMVLLEAMAAAIPVISSNCGGAPEVLGDAGALFPVGDAEALGEALVRQYRSETVARDAMAEALQARLKRHFTDDAVRELFWHQTFAKELG